MLEKEYEKEYEKLLKTADKSKTVSTEEGFRYYDSKGKLLIKEHETRMSVDGDDKYRKVFELYSSDTEQLVFYYTIYRKVAADNIRTALEKIRFRINNDSTKLNKQLR